MKEEEDVILETVLPADPIEKLVRKTMAPKIEELERKIQRIIEALRQAGVHVVE